MTINRKPEWLKVRPPAGDAYVKVKGMLKGSGLHTVCEEARCPNVGECWSCGTATFLIGGDTCTRSCRFCAVKTSNSPPPLDPSEPSKIAETVVGLALKYVVLTSVDRDDLEDGGANHFAETVKAIKAKNASIIVEVLVPDFSGRIESIRTIVEANPDVYGHNLETVRRLHPIVRDRRATYEQSLKTLKDAAACAKSSGHNSLLTKSGFMVGLGENDSDIEEVCDDLFAHDVKLLTIGQYLQPTPRNLGVVKYVTPEEFTVIGQKAQSKGFLNVFSGPLVRSSYRAAEINPQ